MSRFEYLVAVFTSNYKSQLTESQFNLFIHNSVIKFWHMVSTTVPTGYLSIDADVELPHLKFRILSGNDLTGSLGVIEFFANESCNMAYSELMKATPTMPTSISFRRP